MAIKKTTKNERYVAIVDAWRAKYQPSGPFLMEPITEWAIANDLAPAPGVRDTSEEIEAWEKRFQAAKDKP